jgi:PAS domain S-box-containing protein
MSSRENGVDFEQDSHTALCLTIERVFLSVRYLAYLVIVPMFLFGHLPGTYSDIAIITVIVVVHNVFAHWVLWSGQYRFFFSWFNFAIYFAEACLITYFSGADTSEAYLLYLVLIIGSAAYGPQYRNVWGVGLLCCMGLAGVVFVEWIVTGIAQHLGFIAIKFVFLVAVTWLVATLSDQLRRIEQQSLARAQELAGSEATLRTILDGVDDALVVCDESEFITDANDQACRLFGIERDEIVGQRLRRFFFDDGTLPLKLAVVRSRGVGRGEAMIVDTADEEHIVDVIVRSYIRDGRRYYVAILHDVTAAKELQEATRQANEDLGRINEELRQASEVKTYFWTTISRRLRSPLSAVLGNLEMLLEEELGDVSAAQRKALQACRRATLRSFRLVDDALTHRPAGRPPPPNDSNSNSSS